MKRVSIFVALLLALVVSSFLIFGCGTSTSTTTTTTGTVAATQSQTAQSSVLLASGAAQLGTASGNLGSAANSGGSISVSSVRAATGNPPPGLFTQDMTASSDGYFRPLANTLFSGKLTPYIRFINRGGEKIDSSFFSGKAIANLSPCSVESVFAGGPNQPPYGITTGITNFMSNRTYTSIKYMGDYLAWAYIYPTMEAAIRSHYSLPSNVHLTSPEAVDTDKILAMDNKMVYSGQITGEIVVTVSCESDGRAKIGTYTGMGDLLTPVGTVDVTTMMTFTVLGDPPSFLKVIATNEASPFYTTIVYVTNPSTAIGTGEIFDDQGGRVGTLECDTTGGAVTVGETREAFDF